MDPSQVVQHSDTTMALLVGLCMALVKVMEKGWERFASRRGKNGVSHVVASLDPQASAAIATIMEKVTKVETMVERTEERLEDVRDTVKETRLLAMNHRQK